MPKPPFLNSMGCCWATDCRVTLEVGGLEMGSWGRAGSVGGILEVVVDNKLCCWRRDCGVQSLLFRISRLSLVPSGLHVALMSCLERGWMQDKERAVYRKSFVFCWKSKSTCPVRVLGCDILLSAPLPRGLCHQGCEENLCVKS